MSELTPKAVDILEAAIDEKITKAEGRATQSLHSAQVSNIDGNGTVWVRIFGANTDTPVESTTTELKPGDVVSVRISNGKARVVGNYTEPATTMDSMQTFVEEEVLPPIKERLNTAVQNSDISRRAAAEARAIAEATNQYFWERSDDEGDGAGTGAFVTDIPKDEWLGAAAENFPDISDEKPYRNFLINTFGALIRRAKTWIASFSEGNVTFYDGKGNTETNIITQIGVDGAQIGKKTSNNITFSPRGFQFNDAQGATTVEIKYSEKFRQIDALVYPFSELATSYLEPEQTIVTRVYPAPSVSIEVYATVYMMMVVYDEAGNSLTTDIELSPNESVQTEFGWGVLTYRYKPDGEDSFEISYKPDRKLTIATFECRYSYVQYLAGDPIFRLGSYGAIEAPGRIGSGTFSQGNNHVPYGDRSVTLGSNNITGYQDTLAIGYGNDSICAPLIIGAAYGQERIYSSSDDTKIIDINNPSFDSTDHDNRHNVFYVDWDGNVHMQPQDVNVGSQISSDGQLRLSANDKKYIFGTNGVINMPKYIYSARTATDYGLVVRHTDIDVTSTSAATSLATSRGTGGTRVEDSTGAWIGGSEVYLETNGTVSSRLYARRGNQKTGTLKSNYLQCRVDVNGNAVYAVSDATNFRNAIGASSGIWPIAQGGTGQSATQVITTASTLITAASGITIKEITFRRWGKVCHLKIGFTRNAATAANTRVTVGTLKSGYYAGIQSFVGSAYYIGQINSAGVITVCNLSGGSVAAGTQFDINGTFVMA